eukprot:TRINITY_DN5688_c0_g1_i3.p3 TRINITY_DN5688_c0_g1~~TRINITY_DN5688_c0_g1_i3.p3  ORF type:complete len:265 (+),score=-6.04 TRINITY_DN5688_c0_g1_i3:613-1407(+)
MVEVGEKLPPTNCYTYLVLLCMEVREKLSKIYQYYKYLTCIRILSEVICYGSRCEGTPDESLNALSVASCGEKLIGRQQQLPCNFIPHEATQSAFNKGIRTKWRLASLVKKRHQKNLVCVRTAIARTFSSEKINPLLGWIKVVASSESARQVDATLVQITTASDGSYECQRYFGADSPKNSNSSIRIFNPKNKISLSFLLAYKQVRWNVMQGVFRAKNDKVTKISNFFGGHVDSFIYYYQCCLSQYFSYVFNPFIYLNNYLYQW